MASENRRVVRFGVFEVDFRERELRKKGVRQKLQRQPFQVLEALLENPAAVVTREEFKERLWPEDEFGEFDKRLTTAIQKIRETLEDSPGSPRFVETIPRTGYRFIAAVEEVPLEDEPEPWYRRRITQVLLAAAAAAVALVALNSSEPAPETGLPKGLRFTSRPLTFEEGNEDAPTFSPDGLRVAYTADGGKPGSSDLFITLTEPGSATPVQVTNSPLRDMSPAWSPDGSRIVFARFPEVLPNHRGSPFKLMLVPPIANAQEQELTDRVFYSRNLRSVTPSWSSDGNYVVFSCMLDQSTTQNRICLYSLDRRELSFLTEPPGSGVGDGRPVLSPDSRTLVYQASNRPGENGQFYLSLTPAMQPDGEPRPVPGAGGSFRAAWADDGEMVFLLGYNTKGEGGLWTVDASFSSEAALFWPYSGLYGELHPRPNGGLQVAYVKQVEEAELVRVDLRDPSLDTAVVLAPSSRADYHPQYSPDGSQLAFISDRSGLPGVWICNSDGTSAYELAEVGPAGYFAWPMWSPDGKKIATDGFHFARNAHVIQVSTKQVGPALTNREGRMPTWTKDGKSLWYYSHLGGKAALWRLNVDTGEREKIHDAPGILDIDEAPDGDSLYYLQARNVMRVALKNGDVGGEPRSVSSDAAAFALAGQNLYVRKTSGEIIRTNPLTGVTATIVQTDGLQDGEQNIPNLGIAVSPDERWLVFTRWLRRERDLQLMESVD